MTQDIDDGTIRRPEPREFLGSLFGLEGKVALVTGGSKGIGFMIASGLVQAGAKVFIAARDEKKCQAAAGELCKLGTCIAIAADIGTQQGIALVIDRLEQEEGGLHVLVNNAATAWAAPIESHSAEAWDKVMSVNLKSVFLLSQGCLPLLKAAASPNSPARIINIGSIDGIRVPAFETYAYSTSKAGLHHLTRSLAQALGPHDVTVNAIAPGTFPTKLTAGILEQHGEAIAQKSPLRRLGRHDDMAGVAVFLSSPAAAYITGQIIAVDGGLSTRPW